MLLRDPVHGLVAFEGVADRVIGTLLATREVQRLRNVRQLGFTSLVFPGAEHSRFAHGVGAAHVMVRLLARIRSVQDALPPELRIDDESTADALAAALVHDLGHGPFSHLSEEILPHARKHEDWTADIILDPGTDVHAALRGLSEGMPERVVALLKGNSRLGYLARSVSGTLDVDRCDYLLRDSHMTGVRYGIYDLEWLLQALAFTQAPVGGDDSWVLAIEGRKGLPPIEGFFLARLFMYQQVYHHKATRAAEALIRAIFVRVAELVRDGSTPRHTPRAIAAAASGAQVTIGDYLALDDVALLGAFRAWEQGDDPVLSDLTRRLSSRKLPKTVPLPADGRATGQWQEAVDRARVVVQRHGLSPELSVRLDVPSDAPYSEPDDNSPTGLWVLIRHQPVQRLGRISFLLGELRNKQMERPRLIFPAEVRTEVLAALEGVMG
jgi:HD superfamily phosphohydrolase